MAYKYVNKTSVVEATSVYVGSKIVGNDLTVTLPEVTAVTVDVNGLMGTVSIPLLHRLEDMELTISKEGLDSNSAILTSPGKKEITVKWAYDSIDSAGNVSVKGGKAIMSVMPKTISPGIDLEPGETSEGDLTFGVLVLRLYLDGKLVLQINRLTGTIKALNAKGKLTDYSTNFKKLL